MRDALRIAAVPFAGFCSFVASVQLYESFLLLGNVAAFNFSLYGSVAQLFALAAAAAASLLRGWAPSIRVVQISCALAALGLATHLLAVPPAAHVAGAVASGGATAVLALAWGPLIARLSARSVFLFVLGALLASTVLCFACFAVQGILPIVFAVALPLASGVFYTLEQIGAGKADGKADAAAGRAAEAKASGESAGAVKTKAPVKAAGRAATTRTAAKPVPDPAHATMRPAILKSFPWPFLIILSACCLLSAFFVGVTLNPYSFQSDSVSRYMYLFTMFAAVAMLASALIVEHPKAQTFFIAALALLLAGLFLFSTGLIGSIIMPLGLILTAKNCCFALCWITLATLGRTNGVSGVALFACGLFVCNGTLGRSAGMLANTHGGLSFPDIALAASLCIVAFTLFYAFMVASHPKTNKALSPYLDDPFAAGASESPLRDDVPAQPAKPAPAKPEPTAQELVEQARRLQAKALGAFGLTKQEKRIACLVLQNRTYQQIAEECGISERTVKFHAKNVYKKADVEGRRDFEIKMLSEKQPPA